MLRPNPQRSVCSIRDSAPLRECVRHMPEVQTSKIHSHIIKLKIPRCSVLQLHMLKFTYVEACTHKCRRCAEIKHERFEWAPGRSKFTHQSSQVFIEILQRLVSCSINGLFHS
ncbi:hypothetical protein AcV7_006347 [Taiwanofungus camphoratus]|nr:hypothetical protein AcV7_006347 [Antrodia cinnamomea]